MSAWAARGLRVPARNALLADMVPASVYGRAYEFERMMQELSSVLTLAVTDSPEHAVEDPAHDGVIFTELSTKLIAPSSPTSFERVFLGTGPTPALAAPTVNAIVGRHIDTGAILSKASIDSLCLEGVDALEVAHTYALRSRGMPITRFQF